MRSTKRKHARVKLPIRQAIEIEMTLANAREFCGMNGAGSEIMGHLRTCFENISRAIEARNRVVGIKERKS